MISSLSLDTLETLKSVFTWTAAIAGAVTAIAAILLIPIGNRIDALKGARSLSSAQEQTLSRMLPRGPFEPPFLLTVASPYNDPEAQSFAKEIVEQLDRADWKIEFAPNTVFGAMQPRGIDIRLKTPSADRLGEYAEGLAKALSEIGHFDLEAWTDRVRDDLRGGDMVLIIGHK
ncbi:MAG: hypothetical protein MI824_05215 [Hyphomicrobiales bacterium]|nr:hypothetical protein [Hyphomicrobiales bacterium]